MLGVRTSLVSFLLCAVAPIAFAGTPSYELLKVSSGERAQVVRGINGDGSVVFWGDQIGWVYTDADGLVSVADLVDPPSPVTLYPNNIDDDGRICGSFRPQEAGVGFVLDDGSALQLDPLPGRDESSVWDLAGGLAVGRSALVFPMGNSTSRATAWENGVPVDLGGVSGYSNSIAMAVNSAGQIVGSAFQCNFPFEPTCVGRALLWERGTMTDLGLLPGFENARAHDINEAGEVTGYAHATDLSAQHGFLRTASGDFVDLGELPGLAYVTPRGLNDAGQVVGDVQPDESASVDEIHAFLWQDGVMYELDDLIPPDSGWHMVRAWDINDAGQISVWAQSTTGATPGTRAFRLDPVGGGDDPEPVPLTSSARLALLALLLLAAGAAIFRRLSAA